MELFFVAVIILAALAVSDLVVGVSNDAVNFLNSSIGSRVAPRRVIMIIASLGILAGVTFSSGMMEVARKGIFHPQFFNMPELMTIFLAVMITDILLLDLYNTFGLPTSTTVSIVFELLGAAVAVSLIKVVKLGQGGGSLIKYINTGKAFAIISGILLSVVVAFICGAFIQFISRLIFTFDFEKRLRRYGGLWGGAALSTIVYFILIKGAKGSSFMTADTVSWIKSNTLLLLLLNFLFWAVILQLFILFSRINILKIIVLVGTFALAMAFAANDLVNFIGVPLAGLSAYKTAGASADPLNGTMEALQKSTSSDTGLLLLAGIVMVVTLWLSRKARSVTKTEVSLGRQDEGIERFGSSLLSRTVVRHATSASEIIKKVIPLTVQNWLNNRFDQINYRPAAAADGELPSFDLVRASVNLMVASALISLATSMKLPLSTTYVTFMVAMGTSLSDRAWGRESAVFRVTGVLTVIGGWFLTALMAFTLSGLVAVAVFYLKAPGVIAVLGLIIFLIFKNHRIHKNREEADRSTEVFNLKKITDINSSINTSFEHVGLYLQVINRDLNSAFDGVFNSNRFLLRDLKRETRKTQNWANIITANFFKTMRLMDRKDMSPTHRYGQTVGALQEIAECLRDMIMRSYVHVINQHKGLLPVQIDELNEVRKAVSRMLERTIDAVLKSGSCDYEALKLDYEALKKLIVELDQNQVQRIQDDSSKTRLSIMFYGLLRDSKIIAEQTVLLFDICQQTFKIQTED